MGWKQKRRALEDVFGCTDVRWEKPKCFSAEAPYISYSDKQGVFHPAIGYGKTGEAAITNLFNRLVEASGKGRRIIVNNPDLPVRDYAWTGKGFAVKPELP